MPENAPRRADAAGPGGGLDADAARRRALRELARRHHPDRGGDPEEYIRRTAELERRFARPRPLPDGRGSMVQVEAAARWLLVLRRLRSHVRRRRRVREERRRAGVDERLRAGRAPSRPTLLRLVALRPGR